MRLNKFLALATGMSRRAADKAIANGEVLINGTAAELGQVINPEQGTVTWQGKAVRLPEGTSTIMLYKPRGYVCSRDGQGSKTVYDLLPARLNSLKPVGRLDKDSSGLLLLTNDGDLAHKLTHPSFQKEKTYTVELSSKLSEQDEQIISSTGIQLADGPSRLMLESLNTERTRWRVKMSEGRNRQIRRTFQAAGYEVITLHRTDFGVYSLGDLKPGEFLAIQPDTMQP